MLEQTTVSFLAKCRKQRFMVAHVSFYVPPADTITPFALPMPKVPRAPLLRLLQYPGTALLARHRQRDGRKTASIPSWAARQVDHSPAQHGRLCVLPPG